MYRLLLPGLLICASLSAQQYPFDYYTPKDGLVNARVRFIKQDSKGLIYFITYGGLSIYDGYRFKNFTQSDGLAVDLVNDILELPGDTILIATNTNKLNVFAGENLTEYHTKNGFCPTINKWFQTPDGKIFAIADEGLFRFVNNEFARLNTLYNGVEVGRFGERVIQWRDLLFIIPWSRETGINAVVYNIREDRVTDVYGKKGTHSFAPDKHGKLWMSSTDGIASLDIDSLLVGKIVIDKKRSAQSPFGDIKNMTIQFDRQNNAWISDGRTVRKFTTDHKWETILLREMSRAAPITDVFLDRSGVLWIGTDGNGVLKVKTQNIQLYSDFAGKKVFINTLTQHADTVWMFDQLNNVILRHTSEGLKEFKMNAQPQVSGITVSGKSLFLSTGTQALVVRDKNDPLSYQKPVNMISEKYSVGYAFTDPYGAVLLPVRKNDTTLVIARIVDGRIANEHEIPNTFDNPIFDRFSNMWIITRENKVKVYTISPRSENYFSFYKDYTSSFPTINSRSMIFDRSGILWVGTRYKGLYGFRVHPDSLQLIHHFTKNDGLSDNFVSSLACDVNNTLWVGTQSGLDRMYFKNGKYIIGNMSKNNGFFQMIARLAITDRIWASTTEGSVLQVYQGVTDTSISNPDILLRSLLVNNVPSQQLTDFSYKQNNFSFNVAAPYYPDERAVRYSYMLEGSGNNSWSAPSLVPTFNFVNLAPGAYKLHLRAEFPEEVHPPKEFLYSFTIHPPWWNTWGFRIPAMVLFVLACIVIIRNYFKRKMEMRMVEMVKLQAVEKERTRIASDMHDDLGAGLSRIKFLSETIGMKKQQHQPIEEDITKIREYSHEMIDKMGEIVWALNERNDSIRDLVSYTRSYTVEYLSQNGIECSIQMPENIPAGFVSGEFRRNVFLTIKEALHNIVKHSQAKNVTMKITFTGDLRISLHDDGVGFHPGSNGRTGNGVLNMKKRIKDIGGHIELKNTNGTLIELRVPLPI